VPVLRCHPEHFDLVGVEIVVGALDGWVELEVHVPSEGRADVLDDKVEKRVRGTAEINNDERGVSVPRVVPSPR
jgi:hypothetical protein